MKRVTFITGNQRKADFLARHLGHEVSHKSLDLDEIQSLDLEEIATHKARQAYQIIGSPVLVEDVSAVLTAMNELPGPFIKWFEKSMNLKGICDLATKLGDRSAVISVCFAYYNGVELKLFTGSLKGIIPPEPRGTNGFGFDPIFIRKGQTKTFAQMTDVEQEKYSLRTSTVYPKLKKFLEKANG